MAKGKIVSVYGAKGGIGKTTFLLNLAGVMARNNKRVMIVDLDLSNGAVACLLNREVSKTIYNFCDDYNNNRYVDMETYIGIYSDNIHFIASPKDPRQANKIDVKFIDVLLDKIVYKYDCILIDTTHYLSEAIVFALDRSDKILFMTTNDIISLKNLKGILNIMQSNEISNYKLVLNYSVDPNKDYFSLFDIRNVLNANVDYIISSAFYYKKMDSLYLEGEIATLKFTDFKDYKVFSVIARDILEGGKNE